MAKKNITNIKTNASEFISQMISTNHFMNSYLLTNLAIFSEFETQMRIDWREMDSNPL